MTNRLLEIDDRLLRFNLILTQGILFILASIISVFTYQWNEFKAILSIPSIGYILLSVGLAIFIVVANLALDRYVPKKWVEDGEINKRIFQNISAFHILFLCILVGISEEWLFRGIIQNLLGNAWTSLVFTLIHFRYLRKPILVVFVYITSYLLGLLFETSGSIFTSILAHSVIDFVLALCIRKQNRGEENLIGSENA